MMRLWHKKLIQVLPQKQLVSQWRELAALAKDIREKGKTNHILINKIMDFPLTHFTSYAELVYLELIRRGYQVNESVRTRIFSVTNVRMEISFPELYAGWHEKRYLRQCFFNLQEKADCGGIPDDEWKKVRELVRKELSIPD